MHLLNGATAERVRSSDGVTVQGCGCAHTPTVWWQMCATHYEEFATLHQRAREERAIQELTT